MTDSSIINANKSQSYVVAAFVLWLMRVKGMGMFRSQFARL